MNKIDAAWSAGLFDGKGSVRGRYMPTNIAITSTDEDIIDNLIERTGMGRKYGPYERPNHPCQDGTPRKTQWEWIVFGYEQVEFLFQAWGEFLSGRRMEQFRRVLGTERHIGLVVLEKKESGETDG